MAKMPPVGVEPIERVEKRGVRCAGEQRVPQHPIWCQLFDVVDFDNFDHKAGDPNKLSETRKEQWRVKIRNCKRRTTTLRSANSSHFRSATDFPDATRQHVSKKQHHAAN